MLELSSEKTLCFSRFDLILDGVVNFLIDLFYLLCYYLELLITKGAVFLEAYPLLYKYRLLLFLAVILIVVRFIFTLINLFKELFVAILKFLIVLLSLLVLCFCVVVSQ